MARRYEVTVLMTKRVHLDKVWADDETEAEAKAEEIVSGFKDAESAEVISVEEAD